jgi:hypothetical protein
MNNIGYIDYNLQYGISVYDELVVKQDRWVELNGNTLEREVYTDEEFRGDIPAHFSPIEAAMTCNRNHRLYGCLPYRDVRMRHF